MVFTKALKLMKKYGVCPECGNEMISNGKGGLDVEDDYFERWCKCGWRVKVNENDEVID
jgi:predicted RNA-binding Zn-ribbon protein involved in translation (DUF1610 family)